MKNNTEATATPELPQPSMSHKALFLFNFLFGSCLYVGHNDLKEKVLTKQKQTFQKPPLLL